MSQKEYTLQEVSKHNKDSDCWVIINEKVLNLTNFLSDHPGGKKAILLFKGKDASEEFNMLHEASVIEKHLEPYMILGKVKASSKM